MAEGLVKRSRLHGSADHEMSHTNKGARAFEEDVAKSLAAYTAGLDALGDRVEGFLADLAVVAEAFDGAVGSDPK